MPWALFQWFFLSCITFWLIWSAHLYNWATTELKTNMFITVWILRKQSNICLTQNNIIYKVVYWLNILHSNQNTKVILLYNFDINQHFFKYKKCTNIILVNLSSNSFHNMLFIFHPVESWQRNDQKNFYTNLSSNQLFRFWKIFIFPLNTGKNVLNFFLTFKWKLYCVLRKYLVLSICLKKPYLIKLTLFIYLYFRQNSKIVECKRFQRERT